MSGMAKDSSNGDKKQYWRPCGSSPAGRGKLLMEPHPCPWFTFILVLVIKLLSLNPINATGADNQTRDKGDQRRD